MLDVKVVMNVELSYKVETEVAMQFPCISSLALDKFLRNSWPDSILFYDGGLFFFWLGFGNADGVDNAENVSSL